MSEVVESTMMANVSEKPLEGGAAMLGNTSIIDLFLGADWVVQVVILLLLFASIWSWTIIFSKSATLKKLSKQANQFEDEFWSTSDFMRLYESVKRAKVIDPLRSLFLIGMEEYRQDSSGQRESGSLQTAEQNRLQRVDRMMLSALRREAEDLEKNMIFLASVGSTAPFIGLFGTVWGIMNSFKGIAASQSTNLAVVAPGIAEALFATAIGLIAAIPAVLAYNRLSGGIGRYMLRLEGFADEFSTILSRKYQGGL